MSTRALDAARRIGLRRSRLRRLLPAALAAFALAPLLACTEPRDTPRGAALLLPPEQNRLAVERAFDLWAAGVDPSAQLLAPDVRWSMREADGSVRHRTGGYGVVDVVSLPVPNLPGGAVHVVLHEVRAEDDLVVAIFDILAPDPSGATLSHSFHWTIHMAGGRAVAIVVGS